MHTLWGHMFTQNVLCTEVNRMKFYYKNSDWFYPHSISSHKDNFSNLKLQMQYSSLKRDIKAFYLLITELIDLLSKSKVPNYSMDCNLCKFSIKQAEFE